MIMIDPRSLNCRVFTMDNAGKVTGVELTVEQVLESQYRLASVTLFDEYAAGGKTVASWDCRDKNGNIVGETVVLAWPWTGINSALPNRALPGSSEHIISNKYNPPDRGPLAMFPTKDGTATINGDIVGGLGLPYGHHVSYHMIWQERTVGDVNEPEPPPTVDGGTVIVLKPGVYTIRIES